MPLLAVTASVATRPVALPPPGVAHDGGDLFVPLRCSQRGIVQVRCVSVNGFLGLGRALLEEPEGGTALYKISHKSILLNEN
jgi:hypothetical protein